MDEQLIQQLTEALNKNTVVMQQLDTYFRNQNQDPKSPTPTYPTGSYSSINLTNASNLLGTVFTNTSGQITQYSEKFTDALAGVIPGFGGFTAGAEEAADAGLRLMEASTDAALALRQYGYNTEGQILQAERQAAALNYSLDEFVRFIAQESTTLALFGKSVSDGVDQLIMFKNDLRSPELQDLYNRLRIAGVSLTDLNEDLATFAAFNRMGQLQDDQARRDYFRDLVELREAMVGLADITGVSADEQERGSKQFLQSAEFLQARLKFGESDPVVQLAARLGAMGHDTLAKAMVTGFFDPNDPATAMYTSLMPEATRTAMNAGAMMRAGRGSEVDVGATLRQFTLAVEREGENLVNQFGGVAHIVKPFNGAMSDLMGNIQFQNTILSNSNDINKAFDGIGNLGVSADSAAMQMIGMKDNFADMTAGVRQTFAGIENTQVMEDILNVMSDAAEFTGRIGTIGAAIASGDVNVAQNQVDLALKQLGQDPEGNKNQIAALKLQQENLDVLRQMSAGTIASSEAQDILKANLEKLGISAEEIQKMNINDLKATTLNVNIESIAGNRADLSVFNNDLVDLTNVPGYDPDPDLIDRLIQGINLQLERLVNRTQGEGITAAQEQNKRRFRMKKNEQEDLPRDSLGKEFIDKLQETFDSAVQPVIERLESLIKATENGADIQANATRYSSQLMADRALSAGHGQRIASLRGDVTRNN